MSPALESIESPRVGTRRVTNSAFLLWSTRKAYWLGLALGGLCLFLSGVPAYGQTVTASVNAGTEPQAVAVNPVTNKIYVVNSGSGNVTVIDGATNATTTVAAGTNPYAVAVNPVTNKIYVANFNNASVTVIDGATNTTTTLPVGSGPRSVAVNSITNQIYVANFSSSNVTVIDGATNTFTTVAVGTNPYAVAVNPVSNKIYVANFNSSSATVIDGATNTTTAVATGTTPIAVAVNPVTNKIYVANEGTANVTVIDGATNTTTEVPTGTTPIAVAVNPVTNKIYVASEGSAILMVIDGTTNTPTAVLTGTAPIAVAVNQMTNQIYVANANSANVTVIAGATNTTTTVAAGTTPIAVGLNPVTNKIYVANEGSANVTVIDGATNTLTAVATGTAPLAVGVDPVTNKIYVANASGSVTVIDGATNGAATVGLGFFPASLAVNPVTNQIYVQGYTSTRVITGEYCDSYSFFGGCNGYGYYYSNIYTFNVAVINETTNLATQLIAWNAASGSNSINSIAINSATNQIYVANFSSSNVTVIDGATNTTTTMAVGTNPYAVAVNPVTNKIYVTNYGSANVTVIDGATNTTTTVAAGTTPIAVGLNPVTNKIYVANEYSANVTVIDGATNTTTTVAAGTNPYAVAVNPVTNKIYVANLSSNNVTVIDGATNTTTTVAAGTSPYAVGVNPVTNKVYVANANSANVTVIDGATNATTTVAAGTSPYALGVNPVTNQIYLANEGSANITILTEQQVQTIPVTTSISTLPSNQTSNPTPSFTFTASSTFSPTATNVDAVYFQMDTWQGPWAPATAAITPGSFTGTLPPLSYGIHILYAYATDGQDAGSTLSGPLSSSPLIGNITAYLFLVAPQATSTTVSTDVNPSTYGGTVNFTATVETVPASAIIPTGSVTFFDGGISLGTVTLGSDGTATLPVATFTAGMHSITATYTPDSGFVGSTSSAYSQVVNKATPVITWANPSPIIYGAALSSAQLDATVNNGGTLLYTPSSGTVLNLGTGQTLHVDFTPSDTTDYNSASMNVSIDVLAVIPTFAFSLSALPAETFGNAPFSVASYVVTNSPGAIVFALGAGSVGCSVSSAGQVTITGASVGGNYCVISVSQSASVDYSAAGPVSQSFQIAQASPMISISNIPVSASDGGNFTPTYAYTGDGTTSATSSTTSTCTVTSGVVSFVAVGTCTLTAHAAAGTNYAAVDGSAQSFTIGQATPAVSLSNNPSSIWNGLVAYYPFDKDSNDYSGFGNNLQLNGGASIVANGEFGGALSLGNSAGSETDYAIASGDNPNLDFGSSDFTIQEWVNFADVTRIETILEKFTSSGGPGWSLSNIPRELEFYGSSGSSDNNFSFLERTWYQIMVVRSGGTVTVYANTTGRGLNSIGSVALGAIPTSTNPLLVGIRDLAAGQPLGFNGLIDDIAIWDRALTTSEISLLNTNSLSSLPQTSFSANICHVGQTTPTPCSQTGTLNYNVNADTTFGANPTVLTLGAPNLDFTLSSTTCTGTVTAGNSCTVAVKFAPLAPGLRMGAVQLTDSSGNLLVTTFVQGIGQGPAIAFGPGAQTTVGTGLNFPFGVALDGVGDVFIADTSNNRVVEVPAGGGAQTTVGSGLSFPESVALDGAGNVFIADTGNDQVVEVPAGGAQTWLPISFNSPTVVAVDGAGNVFIADRGNNRVVEVPAGGGAQTTVGTGLNSPAAVSVDGVGDVFIADTSNNRVVEVPAGGGAQTTVGTGLNSPTAVAVDGAGDVFIADTGNDRVVEVPAGGGAQTTVGSGLHFPRGVALDGAGDVFIADYFNSRVVEVPRSQPPTLSFAATGVGNTSTDSPQSVTVQNIGNQPLAAVPPGLSVGSNSFVQVAGSGNPADCTNAFSLAPGASCNLSISFIPQTAGSIVSAATFADNALNAPAVTPATQSVTLAGTGQAASQTISFTQAAPASASYYSAFTVAAQSTSGLTVTLSVDSASTSVCSVGAPSVSGGVTSATVAMLSATGTCTIDANQSGNSAYSAAAQLQTSATAAILGISLTVTNTNDSGFGSLRNAIANASSGNTINFSLAYPATITLSSTLQINTSLTISGPGASNVMISGNGSVQVFNIGGGITATISGLTIQNGSSSSSSGGGIYNSGTLMLSNSTLSGNSVSGGFAGGAIYNGGTLVLSDSTVSGNSASNGGGIFNGGGTLTITNSTLSGNSAIGFGFSAVGAGIFIDGGTVNLTNSTLSGNSAGVGGGIYTLGATVTLTNSTLSGNSASYYGGGAIFVYNGTVTSKNTILANNTLGNCGYPGMISQGYNLSDDTSCSGALTQTGDLNNTPAGLDPNGLGNNGGPTQTIALLATSPAVDTIPLSPINYCTDTSGNPVTTDQRGVARPQGAACDIGAFELTQAQTATLSQTVSFTTTAPGTASYNSAFTVAAQSTSGLTVTLSADSGSTSVCSLGAPSVASGVTSATVTMLSGTGTCTIFAIQLGNASYKAAATQQTSATAALANQTALTVTGPASVTYGTTGTATATGGSGTGLLSFSAGASTSCSVLGTTVSVSNVGGTCSLTATKAADNSYTAATSAVFPVALVPANQTITFTGAPATAAYGSSFTVAASASSGLTVTIGSSGACSISGGTVTMTASSGTCSLTASQSGNTNYNAATPVAQSTTATKAAPTINWTAPAAITYGTALSGTQLDATATYNGGSVAGTFVYSPAKGTVLTAGIQTLSVTFTPTKTTDYLAATGSVTLEVDQATPKITWPKPAAITYGTVLSATQLDATANVPGTFVYSPAASTVLTAGAQTLSVTFTPTDTIDYANATDTVTITVNKAALRLTWATPSPITYGTALTSAQLDATASVPGSFVYSPAAGTVEGGGSDKLSVTFTPTDNVDYTTGTASVTLQVNPATPTINWPTPAAITFGTALSGTQLDATATYNGAAVAGAFVYTPAKGVGLGAGAQTLSVTFTPNNTANYAVPPSATVTLQVNQATPKITWAKPAAITYGTVLSATQLDATANVPGTFVYSPAASTVLTAGAQTLSVTFTPTDTIDYANATDTVTITVNQASSTTTITSNIPNPATVGQVVIIGFLVTGTFGVPTRSVTVTASAGESCSGPLSGTGTGSCTLTFTASGSPKLTASYGGDSNFKSSSSAKITETVN